MLSAILIYDYYCGPGQLSTYYTRCERYDYEHILECIYILHL